MASRTIRVRNPAESQQHLIDALRRVLATREAELLEIKGPCRVATCTLHHAHLGPCDIEGI